ARLALAVLLSASAGMGQSAEAQDAGAQPATAQAPQAADQVPLTPRERELLQRVQELEERLKAVESKVGSVPAEGAPPVSETKAPGNQTAPAPANNTSPSAQYTPAAITVEQENKPKDTKKWGEYTPNLGFKVANTEHGDLSISIYTYARY